MAHRFRHWRCILVAAELLVACPAASQDLQPERPNAAINIADHVRDASLRFGIPEQWIWAVMRVESAGRVDATSHAGAMGLMQVMPGTWANLTARHGLGGNAYNPRANIMAGAAYLRDMHDRYGSPGFLAAYNAGPGRYEQYARGERPLPLETRNYVAKLAPMIGAGSAAESLLAVQTGDNDAAFLRPSPRPNWTQGSLFIVRPNDLPSESDALPDVTPSPARGQQAAPLNGLFAPISGRSTQ